MVESKRIKTIRCGETTFSAVRHLFDCPGLPEYEWMPKRDAKCALGIRSENLWPHPEPSDRFDQDTYLMSAICDACRFAVTLLADREHGQISGDLFIGRTGFRGTLPNQALDGPPGSTGVFFIPFFIQQGIEEPVRHIPDATWDPNVRTSHHRVVVSAMDGVREFPVPHHRGAARVDNAYWRGANTRPIPDGLTGRLEHWHAEPPSALPPMGDTRAAKETQLHKDQQREPLEKLPSPYARLAQVH